MNIPPGVFDALGPIWGGIFTVLSLIVLAALGYLWRQGKRRWGLLLHWLFLVPFLSFVVLGSVWYLREYRDYGVWRGFEPGEIGFLIGSIPGDAYGREQQNYAQAIMGVIAGATDLHDVRVKLLKRALPPDPDSQHSEALDLGRRLVLG